MYFYYDKPSDWKIEQEIKINPLKLGDEPTFIRPDVIFTKGRIFYFLEIDRTQSMQENKRKIEQYSKLDSAIHQQYGNRPVIVFYTLTTLRRDHLKELCKKNGLVCEVYSKEDLR